MADVRRERQDVGRKTREVMCRSAVRIAVLLLLAVVFGLGAVGTEGRTSGTTETQREKGDTTETYHVSAGERLATAFRERGLAPELVVMAIAALPVVELRGAVPVGMNVFGMPWYRAVLLSIVGNLAPILIILLFVERVAVWLSRSRAFARFFDWLYARTRRRSGFVERYRFWGLVFFVAIPLPITGAWTGSVAAVLLGIGYWRALAAIALGVCIAAAVVTSLSLLGKWGAVVAGTVLVALAARALVGRKRNRQSV